MTTVFFISSAGDTDLAKATIEQLRAKDKDAEIAVIPLTKIALERFKTWSPAFMGGFLDPDADLQPGERSWLEQPSFSEENLEWLLAQLPSLEMDKAYIGVPSPNQEQKAFQIAARLKVPYVLAYEFMFEAPREHALWETLPLLAWQDNVTYAVALSAAGEDIKRINHHAKSVAIGHLSIDAAQRPRVVDTTVIKSVLKIEANQELGLISGTTQPAQVDYDFLTTLLEELQTGRYPNMHLRFGVHPGVANLDNYLRGLVAVCARFATTQTQFQIILPQRLQDKLQDKSLLENPFILKCEVSGPDAASAADKIAQAVPGALLNEGALQGKPVHFGGDTRTYLDPKLFLRNPAAFFSAQRTKAHQLAEFAEEKETAPERLANYLLTLGR